MSDVVVITPDRGVHQSFVGRLRVVWPLLRIWIGRDLRSRYRQSVLRWGWSIIQPVVLLLSYGWVLTSVLRVGQEPVPYLTFAWAGLVPYTFVQQCLGAGVASITDSGYLVAKVYFPREVLPLSVVGVGLVDLSVTSLILIVVSWVQIGPPSVHILGALAGMAVLVVWVAAVTVASAAAAVFRRDLRHAMPLVIRVLFIVSPVMYSLQDLTSTQRRIADVNPVTATIEAVRDGVVRHRWPDLATLGIHGALALVAAAGAILFVRRVERTMSDHV